MGDALKKFCARLVPESEVTDDGSWAIVVPELFPNNYDL